MPIMKPSRLLIPSFLLSISMFAGAQYQTKDRTIPCKTEAVARACYWTHGRLGFGNGTPALRLWKIGTKRILGIYSGPSTYDPLASDPDKGDNEGPQLPLNLVHALWHYKSQPLPSRIFADFEVCPLEPERSGAMQAACVESAKKILIGQ
jgi:hypothetical protein